VRSRGTSREPGGLRVQRMSESQLDLAVTSPVARSPDGSQFAYGLRNGTVAVANTP